MPLCKRVTCSGVVLEQEVFHIAPNTQNLRQAEPKPLILRTDEEREEYNRKQSLKRFVRLVNANFSPTAYYVTLTYDNEHLAPDFAAAKRDLDNYIRRMQYAFPAMTAVAVMGRGKRGGRIHFHLIVSGATKRALAAKWTRGKVKRIEPLRAHNFYNGIDHGADYTGLAAYLFDHWSEEQGGKRWKQTKTIGQPVKTRIRQVKREYSKEKPPQTPQGYMLQRYIPRRAH